jgi:hypothetical protein
MPSAAQMLAYTSYIDNGNNRIMMSITGRELHDSCNPWCRTVIQVLMVTNMKVCYVYKFSICNLGCFGTT